MSDCTLHLDATVADLVDGITSCQANAKVGLVRDIAVLALAVRHQLDTGNEMARAADLTLDDLAPRGVFWEEAGSASVQTIIFVEPDAIVISRGQPPKGVRSGSLHLHLHRARRD